MVFIHFSFLLFPLVQGQPGKTPVCCKGGRYQESSFETEVLGKVVNGIGPDTKKPSRDEKVLSAFRIKVGRPEQLLSEPHQVFDIVKVNFFIKQDNSRECVDLYRKGLSLRDIGKELNISKTTVRSYLIKAGVELNLKDPTPNGVSRWRTRKTKTPPPFGYCYFQGRLVENPIEYDVLLNIHRQWKEGRDAKKSLIISMRRGSSLERLRPGTTRRLKRSSQDLNSNR